MCVCVQPENLGCWVGKTIENLTHCPNPTAQSPKITWFVSLSDYPPCLPFFSPSARRRWRFSSRCLNCDDCVHNKGSNEVAGKWFSSWRMHNNTDKSSPVSWGKKERLRGKWGKENTINKKRAGWIIGVHQRKQLCSVEMSSGGTGRGRDGVLAREERLFKVGYRRKKAAD